MPQALVPIDTPLSIIRKHIPRQSDIDKIVKNIETHVIHSLELSIQAQDLIKAYQYSTLFHDIYQYITNGKLPSSTKVQNYIRAKALNYIIIKIQNRLECKINYILPALLPNKINTMQLGLVTSGEGIRNKRAIPTLAIIQGVAAIGGMMIKRINALVDAKRASSFNNAIKLINENVQITHDRLITLENRTAMMAKAIIPVLKDFKQQINNTNDRLNRQYRMMTKAHDRYNRLFRQTHRTIQIHHLALLMVKDYITILVGMLQRIHRQYVRYESALDDTLIGIEHLNYGYLTHRILDPRTLARYLEAVEDDLEETAPAFEPVFTNVYQYHGNSLISFTNIIDDLLLQLPILIILKAQVPMSLFSIETTPAPLDAETSGGEKRVHSDNTGNGIDCTN